MFGGCYFAASGRDQSAGQAFASGVFARMIRDQDHVTWTADALHEDAGRLRTARSLKLVFTLCLTLAAVGIISVIGTKLWHSGER